MACTDIDRKKLQLKASKGESKGCKLALIYILGAYLPKITTCLPGKKAYGIEKENKEYDRGPANPESSLRERNLYFLLAALAYTKKI